MPLLRQSRYYANVTTLPTGLIQDASLSFKARGILFYLLSKPTDEDVSLHNIAAMSKTEGLSAVRSGMQELQAAGYIRLEPVRNARGVIIDTVWQVSDMPSVPDITETPSLPSEIDYTEHLPIEHHERVKTGIRPELSSKELLDLYNAEIPVGHPQLEKASARRLESAAKALKQQPTREFWMQVFDEIHFSQLLRGKCKSEGHAHFIATIDWILANGKDRVENYVKVYEGRYRDEDKKHITPYTARNASQHEEVTDGTQ